MKAVLIFMVFLLLSPIAMADNTTIPNITIKIPNFNHTKLFNITILNTTRISDVLEIFGANIYDILQDRINKAVGYLLNRIMENIARTVNESIPEIVNILIKGNTSQSC
jgi:hypothetical protein